MNSYFSHCPDSEIILEIWQFLFCESRKTWSFYPTVETSFPPFCLSSGRLAWISHYFGSVFYCRAATTTQHNGHKPSAKLQWEITTETAAWTSQISSFASWIPKTKREWNSEFVSDQKITSHEYSSGAGKVFYFFRAIQAWKKWKMTTQNTAMKTAVARVDIIYRVVSFSVFAHAIPQPRIQIHSHRRA